MKPAPTAPEAAQIERTSVASERTDEELLLAYRDRADRRAFAELVKRYEKELFNYLRRFLGNAALAEDIFQATFLQVHLKCDQFEAGRSVRPWLYSIATHQAIDAQRRNKRHRMVSLDRGNQPDASPGDLATLMDLLVSRESGPLATLEGAERAEWMRKRLLELPEALRIVVTMVYYQGLKYREAAEALGVPVGTIKSRMHAALLKLNQAWVATHKFDEISSDA